MPCGIARERREFRIGFHRACHLVFATTFTARLEQAGTATSMDGRGRAIDNVFVERLWRTVKYEEIYVKDYASAWDVEDSPDAYFRFYCEAGKLDRFR